jgi:hypothetical protein
MKTRVTTISNLVLSLTFCLGLQSCNKSDFYEKEFLENPFQEPTTTGSVDSGQAGGVSGTVGGTQGGVDSGATGGTTGSTTGSSTTGSTTGTTTGSTTGGTVGGVTGSTTSGTTTGSTVGGVDGSATSGTTTGTSTGTTTGSTVGGVTGSTTSGSTTGGTSTGGTTGSTTGGTTGVVYESVEEIFHQTARETKKLDILWVVDDSGSMSDEQTALGTNFSAFIDAFIMKDVDFKMAITTTDTSSINKKGKMVYGSDTKLTSAKAAENVTQFKADFKSLVKVGISGDGYEKGLEAAEGFLPRYPGFLRSDAYLAVVVISDEPDQSSKTVEAYTDYYKSFKSEGGLVKVYSIVDTTGTSTLEKRYALASANTAGTVADIHNSFYNSLSDMGDTIINLLDSFALANNPVAGSLKVYVNGSETTSYSYDAASRSIKFDQGSLPPVGAEVKVTYLK